MKLGEKIKQIFNPSNWTDKAFLQNEAKSFSSNDYRGNSYIGVSGIHNYAKSPKDNGFTIIDPYRSLIYGGYAQSNLVELFHCIPEIFAPIHAIASRIANADFQLRKSKNDQIVYDNDNWNRLFNTPNPLQNFRDLIYEAVVYEIVTGNELMYFNTPGTLQRNYQSVSTIWNLPSNEIDIVPRKPFKLYTATTIEDIILEYKLDDNNRFQPEHVLHIKSTNLKWDDKKIKGKSPLLSADKAIQNLIAVYEARNVIYTKRGALGFIVSRKTDDSGRVSLTKSEKEGIRDQYYGDYGITGGRSPVGITEAPVEFVKVGANINELEPFKETIADAKAIYSVLGVPEDLMPNDQGATFQNQLQAERRLYQSVVLPKAEMYMQSITNQLGFNEAELYLYASFEKVEALQENKKEKAIVDKTNGDMYLQRFISGVSPLNEWVVATGNEKVPNPLYDLRLFDMNEEQLAQVKAVLNMKTVNQNGAGENTGTTDQNAGQN